MTLPSWVLLLIPEPRIDQVQDSVRVVFDKGLDVLISSKLTDTNKRDKHKTLIFEKEREPYTDCMIDSGGYNVPLQANPFTNELKVVDCGDVPVTS